MLQARIGQLPAHLRQLLRAASVFGESACLGGVAALLQRREDGELAAQVKALEEREILLYLGEQSLRRADRAALSPLADARCGLQPCSWRKIARWGTGWPACS